MIPQAPLVAAQSRRQAVGRSVEGGIRLIRLPMGLKLNASTHMCRDHGAVAVRVSRKRYRNLQRIPEVLLENSRKAVIYVRSQRVTDVQLLSFNGELHNHFCGLKRGGLPPSQHAL
jgi:hypothetical protein